jgi:hypothetical protein
MRGAIPSCAAAQLHQLRRRVAGPVEQIEDLLVLRFVVQRAEACLRIEAVADGVLVDALAHRVGELLIPRARPAAAWCPAPDATLGRMLTGVYTRTGQIYHGPLRLRLIPQSQIRQGSGKSSFFGRRKTAIEQFRERWKPFVEYPPWSTRWRRS